MTNPVQIWEMSAALVRAVEESPGFVTVALTGELHARALPNTISIKPRPMAYAMTVARPAWRIVPLKAAARDGFFWGCSASACGPLAHIELSPPEGSQRLITVRSSMDAEGFAGRIDVGHFTVSAPYDPAEQGAAGPGTRRIAADFRNDRIVLTARVGAGPALTFLADTGGGWNAISKTAAYRLAASPVSTMEFDSVSRALVNFPAALSQQGIPAPESEPWLKGRLVVLPDGELNEDGFLGSRWFAGRVWELDYRRQSIQLIDAFQAPASARAVPLGFRLGADGTRDLNFPRVAVEIDGVPIDMLLDTGATASLTPDAAGLLGLAAGSRVATSFISKSAFETWAARHPDWRLIPQGDALGRSTFPMIEVPSIAVAGQKVGPVWFTQRPDASFRSFMSSMTDKPVEGALGGSALRYFKVILDYPQALAYFDAGQ